MTNPSSNLKLGSGVAPVQAFRRAGATLALGTDGASSNDSQNMWDTLKCAAIVHKVYGQPRDWVGARDALRAAWQGGASALRQPVGALGGRPAGRRRAAADGPAVRPAPGVHV